MSATSLEKCPAYVLSQGDSMPGPRLSQIRPTVTISRETGAGARTVGQLLRDRLSTSSESKAENWTIYDQEIVKLMLEQHRLPPGIEHFLPEDGKPLLEDALEDLLGLHPLVSELVLKTTATILHLCRAGGAIIIGRGGNLIAAHVPGAIHVRLIAPIEARIQRIVETRKLDEASAAEYVRKLDRARRQYVRRNYRAEVGDPHHYHMVLDTGRLGLSETARLIASAVKAGNPS